MTLDKEVGGVRTRLRRIQVSQVKLLVETCYSMTDDVIEEMVCAKIPTHSQLDTHQELKDKIDQRDELIRSLQDVLGTINSERLRFQCACEGIELQLQGELQELKEVAIQGKIAERREQAAGAEEEEETAPPPQPVPEPEGVSLDDEEDPRKYPPYNDADKEHSAWGSSLDGIPEVPLDDGAGDIELQAPQEASRVATHHKIESLEDLEEVKGKMKLGNTVDVDLMLKLLKDSLKEADFSKSLSSKRATDEVQKVTELDDDNGSADMGNFHKVAELDDDSGSADMGKVHKVIESDDDNGSADMGKVHKVIESDDGSGSADMGKVHKVIESDDDNGSADMGKVHKVAESDDDNGSADMGKVHKVADFLKAANDRGVAVKELLLGDNKLGVAGMDVLAPQLPKGLKGLNLMNNGLGVAGMEVLAPYLPKGLKDLNLMRNKFGVKGMKVLVPHLPDGLTTLYFEDNGLDNALDWEPLLRFLLREGLLGSNLVINGVKGSKTDPMVHEGVNRGWKVFLYRPYLRYFFKALVLQFGLQAAVVRWIVVLSCIVAFVLPVFFSRESYGSSDGDDDEAGVGDDSNQSSSNFIAVSLAEVCDSNTEALGDLFVDPVSGLMLVCLVAAMFVVFQVFAQPLKNLAVNITKSLFPCKSCSVIIDTFLRKTEDKVDGAKPILDTGVDCSLSKVQRSFFLFVHLLVLLFVLGDYFVWSNPVPFDSALCRPALTTAIIFYKPFIVSAFYCLNYVSDATGWMLWHNPLTDSIVAVLLILLLLWFGIATIFSGPLLACFFFFAPMICYVPVLPFFFATKDAIFNSGIQKPGEEDWDFAARMKATEKQRTEGQAAAAIFKRLNFYSYFTCYVFAISLYPYYEGEDYAETTERVMKAVWPSLSFWSPEFLLSFSWPRVSIPSQIGLALSIGAFSLEYLLLAWQVGLAYMYPLGYAFDGMYEKEPALHKAARVGSPDVVKALVDAEAKLDLVDADGRSALHHAAERGSAEMVKVLVDAKANLDLVSKDGKSALHWAAQQGSAEVVKVLVNAKANLDLVDKNGKSALLWAAQQGFAEVLNILVDAKANLDLVGKLYQDGTSYFLSVLENLNLSLPVEVMVKLGLVGKEDGYSALHWAAQQGSAEMVKILVDAKANRYLVDVRTAIVTCFLISELQ